MIRTEISDSELRKRLPYARHVSSHVIALDSGALMTAFALDGASFETRDLDELNARHERLNAAWRSFADDRLALWHHIVRQPLTAYPAGSFQSAFAKDLDAAYAQRLSSRRMFGAELFLTLVLHPGPAANRRHLARALGRSGDGVDPADLRRLEDAARDLAQLLGRYSPRRLGVPGGGLERSEPLEMLRRLLGAPPGPMALPRGHLGSALYAERIIFGFESLEIRGPGASTYGAMLGVKAYPAATRPGIWDELLTLPFPLVLAQSFAPLSRAAGRAVLERKQNQMVSSRDRAASQTAELDEALDDLVGGRFIMGDHMASVLVLGETPRAVDEACARTRAALADAGLVAVREDLGLEAAFWSIFPGQFRLRPRPAAITSRNFASFAPFNTYPAGRAEANHWGPAVALLRTAAGTPFHFNFHVGDVGHTFICGPTGSGKTVIQNFLLAQLEKLGARQVFIDKDRGAEIFVRACGGDYFTLRNGAPTGFAPLKALSFSPADQAFLGVLLRRLLAPGGETLTPQAEHAIDRAIAAIAPLPARDRSFGALRALLGQQDVAGVGARLERWMKGAALGWVFDNDEDDLHLSARFLGFDMTELLDHPEVRNPAMLYLFHRLHGLIDGRRLVVDIDEFWKALADKAFTDLAQDGLKTWRKLNAALICGTQSPADVLKSPIAHTIVEMCATKIFLPNPQAQARDYCDGFGLSEAEFRLVRDLMSPEQHRFLVKQGRDSVVVELDLSGLDGHLAVLSARAESLAEMDRLRQSLGPSPQAWLGPFMAAHQRSD